MFFALFVSSWHAGGANRIVFAQRASRLRPERTPDENRGTCSLNGGAQRIFTHLDEDPAQCSLRAARRRHD